MYGPVPWFLRRNCPLVYGYFLYSAVWSDSISLASEVCQLSTQGHFASTIPIITSCCTGTSAGFWLGGSMPPWPPEAKFFFENLTTKWCILSFLSSLLSFTSSTRFHRPSLTFPAGILLIDHSSWTQSKTIKSVEIRQSCISSVRNCTYTEWTKKLHTEQVSVATYARCCGILQIHSRIFQWRNFENRLRFDLTE